MIGKYFHKRLYECYIQLSVGFLDFLANASDKMFFFNKFSISVYFLLIISWFLQVYFFQQVLQICYFSSWFMVLQLRLCHKKKVDEHVFCMWTSSNLDGTVIKNFCVKFKLLYLWQQPLFLCLTYLFAKTFSVTVSVTVTVLHDIEFYSICVLWYSRSFTSTMFIDKKTVLFLLIMPMIPFRDCV